MAFGIYAFIQYRAPGQKPLFYSSMLADVTNLSHVSLPLSVPVELLMVFIGQVCRLLASLLTNLRQRQ